MRTTATATVLLALALLAGCDSTGPEKKYVDRVIISPAGEVMYVGEQLQFRATVLDEDGVVLHGRTLDFISTNPSVVTVTLAGLARAVAPGTASLTVSVEGVTGEASVTVSPYR